LAELKLLKKAVINFHLHVNDVERTRMSFPVHDGSHTTSVTSASDHAHVARLELDGVDYFAGCDIQTNGVVNLNHGVRVSESPTVARVQIRDIFGSSLDSTDAAELILGLLVGYSMYSEPKENNFRKFLNSNNVNSDKPSFHVKDQPKVFVGLVDLDDIHKSSGIFGVSADLAVNLFNINMNKITYYKRVMKNHFF